MSVLLSAFCWGETVTIAPASGVYTNVAARFSGATDVVVNSGTTGGGLVRLNPGNDHTGTTTLNSGTLILDRTAPLGGASQLGATGTLMAGPGTVRYTGPADAEIGHDITSACTGYGTIFDISNDVWITGTVDYSKGSFVKTGPGTLHLAGTGSNTFTKAGVLSDSTSGIQTKFVPNANGDAPTKGYRGFHVLEGTLVLGEKGGVYQIGSVNDASVGGWTTDVGQENDAALEIRGGFVNFVGWMMHASYNGKKGNGTDHPPHSTIRVYDGELRVNSTFAMGRNKLGYSKFAQLNEPRLEVYGGVVTCKSGLSISDDRGANSTVFIQGGTVNTTGVYTERVTGHADTKATVVVTGTGRLVSSGDIYAGTKTTAGGTAFDLIVTNGGYVAATYICTKSDSPAKFDVLVDDGTLACSRTSDGWFLSVYLDKVEIGTRGATLYAPSGYYGGVKANLTAVDTFPDEEPRGVKILAPGTTQAELNFNVPQSWKGPTYIGPYVRVRFFDTGALPVDSPVTMAPNARLSVGVPVTFSSLTLGSENGLGDVTLSLAKGAGITVNGPLAFLGDTSVQLNLFADSDWTEATAGTYPVLTVPKAYGDTLKSLVVTRGNVLRGKTETFEYVETDETVSLVYTLTDVHAPTDVVPTVAPTTTVSTAWSGAAADGLWATGGNWDGGAAVNADGTGAVFPALDGATDAQAVSLGDGAATVGGLDFTGTLGYTIGSGTLTFANGSDAAFIKSVGGGEQTVSANLVSSKRVMVNPSATGAGQVTLSGSKAGLAGGLSTGSGTTVLDSLAFVQKAEDLVIGPGTLKYTGTGETIPGLTLNAGASRAAILDIANDLTLESVHLGTSAFLKTGAGTLRLKGCGFFNLGNSFQNANKKAGIGVYGDSPVDSIQGVNLGEGTLRIGTVDDAADAPEVYAKNAIEIGIRTAGTANGRTETAGALVMNNGSLTSAANIELGYYNGTTNTVPEGGTRPRLVINGGTVSINELHTDWDWGYEQNVHAEVEVNGGEFGMNKAVLQCMPGPAEAQVNTTWTQNGGFVHCTGVVIGQYAMSPYVYGPFTMDLNGGIFAVTNTGAFVISNNVDATINVNAGAVFQTASINGTQCGANTVIRFNGGTWRGVVPTTGNPEVKNVPHIYAKKTIDFDTSADMGLGTTMRYWYYINQKIEADPEAEESVGFAIRGGGDVIFANSFSANTLTAPIHVTDKSGLLTRLTSLSNSDVVVDPGSMLRNYDRNAVIRNLTLGATGGTETVILDLNMANLYAKTNLNMVVTGTLNVLSPVGLVTHELAFGRAFQQMPNTYTVLVYQASNAIDVSKFGTVAHEQARQTTWSEVTISGGTYDGWKALVATVSNTAAPTLPVAGADRVWTAVADGGAWSSGANWNGAAEAPNGAGAAAPFLAATAPGVAVNVDAPVTAHTVTLRGSSAQNGYTLTGQSLTLASGGTASSTLDVTSGNHTLENPLVLGNRTLVSTISNVAGNARLVIKNLQGNGQIVCINRNSRSGGGEVVIEKASGVSDIATGCGRTILKDLTWAANNATRATPLETGPGTLRYEGPSITIPGIALSWGQNYASILDIAEGTTLGVKKMTASSTGFIKTGPGDLKLTGTGSFTLGNKSIDRGSNDVFERPNGDSPYYCFRHGNLGEGRIIQGTVGDPNDAPVVTCADMNIGLDVRNASHDTEYIVNNGKLIATSSIYASYYQGMKGACTCAFTINGGSVTSVTFRTSHTGSYANYGSTRITVNGGRWDNSGAMWLGYQRSNQSETLTTSIFTVNGGEVNVGGFFYLVYLDYSKTDKNYRTTDGRLYVNGGVLNVKGLLNVNRDIQNNAYVWLSGGTFAAEGITMTRGTGYLYGNGGVFAPYGVTEANRTLNKLTAVYASTNGLVVSGANLPAGAEYVIAQPILTDPALGTTDGGFTKTGAGAVALTAENTFTGPTRVASGVLRVTCDGALSDDVWLANAGTLDLSAGAIAVARLTAQGSVANGQLTVKGSLVKDPDLDSYLRVDGDLTVPGTATLDFGLADDDPSPAYRVGLPLVEVSGTATVPSRMKVVHGGTTVKAAKIELVDGVYYAVPTSSGTVICIR